MRAVVGALLLSLLVVVVQVDARASKCELPCRNKGVCTNRRELNGDVDTTTAAATTTTTTEHHRFLQQRPHCQCPVGFTGVLCEVKYVLCGSAEDTCFNESPCQRAVDDFGTEFFHCECDAVQSDLSLPNAQKFCEHVSTVFCNTEKNDPHQSRGSSFCSNGGKCKDTEEKGHHHAGCECPSGFSGQHCEISDIPPRSKGSSALDTLKAASTNNPKRRVLLSIVVFISLMVLFATIGFTAAVYYGQQRQKKNWKKRKTAVERARIPTQKPVAEIELT